MPLTFRQFRNKVTGQVFYAPAGRYGNFLNSIKKIVNYVRYNMEPYYLVHLTLTVAENVSEIDSKHLHRVLQFINQRLKREGSDFKYISVKELQERGAIHYHILCVYSKRYKFPAPDEIAKSWDLGFVKITAPKIRMKLNAIAGYIGKYIGKGYDYEELNVRKSFTASQIKSLYKMGAKRIDVMLREFGKTQAEAFSCTFTKAYLIVRDICEIMGKEVFGRNRRKNVKPSTIVKELGLLRRMFNVARKQWKWKIANPVADIELPRVKNERVRYLSPEEYEALFEALETAPEKWLKPCIIIAIDTGLRLSNVTGLMWSDINLFSKMLSISAEQMKNTDYIGIPLTDRVFEALKELQKVKCLTVHVLHDNGVPLYYVKIQRAFKTALKTAQIENFHFHDLRHCFCSYMRQRGVDLHTIAVLAGHRDLRMTKRYAHLNVDSLRDAINVLGHVLVTVKEDKAIANL